VFLVAFSGTVATSSAGCLMFLGAMVSPDRARHVLGAIGCLSSPVDFSPMADLHHQHDQHVVLDAIDYAVITYSDA
jgi:hypothetical protein